MKERNERICADRPCCGRGDPFFIPPGAKAFRRDNPNAMVQFLDTEHFALETHLKEIVLRRGLSWKDCHPTSRSAKRSQPLLTKPPHFQIGPVSNERRA
jgi:hypothetical protein